MDVFRSSLSRPVIIDVISLGFDVSQFHRCQVYGFIFIRVVQFRFDADACKLVAEQGGDPVVGIIVFIPPFILGDVCHHKIDVWIRVDIPAVQSDPLFVVRESRMRGDRFGRIGKERQRTLLRPVVGGRGVPVRIRVIIRDLRIVDVHLRRNLVGIPRTSRGKEISVCPERKAFRIFRLACHVPAGRGGLHHLEGNLFREKIVINLFFHASGKRNAYPCQ